MQFHEFLSWPNAVQYICINDLPQIMDKLSHNTLYSDDTNITVTSTDCNDLHETVNVTLQLISEWFQINHLVLNNNKTFPINFPYTKTPTRTLNITLDNQNLTLTQSTNFLCTHLYTNLYTNLSWTLHGKIIEETEYSGQFGGEFILLSDYRLIKDSLFLIFSVAAILDNFLWLTYEPT
jgi:hypothetical protein